VVTEFKRYNTTSFAAAFSCKAGAKLVKKPKDVCKVW